MYQNLTFQGRPNKPDDTCYSFWVGATLSILSPSKWSQELTLSSSRFVFSTQDPIVGGLAKWPDQTPDPLHTCLGLAGWNNPLRPIRAIGSFFSVLAMVEKYSNQGKVWKILYAKNLS